MLVLSGCGELNPRLRSLIAQPSSDSARFELLMEMVSDELGAWDGAVAAPADVGPLQQSVALRLSLRDQGLVGFALDGRLEASGAFPEDGVGFEINGVDYWGDEDSPGWSTPLATVDGRRWAPSAAEWAEGVAIASKDGAWVARLRSRQARIFALGALVGLSGYVEVDQIPESGPFLVAYSNAVAAQLTTWGIAAREWKLLGVQGAVPDGWSLAKVEGPDPDVDPGIAALSPDKRPTIRLVGGLRVRPRQARYFDFAPPAIVTSGIFEKAPCFAPPLADDCIPSVWPDGFPRDSLITVKASALTGGVARRSLTLSDGSSEAEYASPGVDQWGQEGDGDAVARGAWTDPVVAVPSWSPHPLMALTELAGDHRGFALLGWAPGEILFAPREGMTPPWPTYWAIPLGRAQRKKVYFVGRELTPPGGRSYRSSRDRRALREWKKYAYRDRLHHEAEGGPEVVALWKAFLEVARRA
jgi:hypothetical protein